MFIEINGHFINRDHIVKFYKNRNDRTYIVFTNGDGDEYDIQPEDLYNLLRNLDFNNKVDIIVNKE